MDVSQIGVEDVTQQWYEDYHENANSSQAYQEAGERFGVYIWPSSVAWYNNIAIKIMRPNIAADYYLMFAGWWWDDDASRDLAEQWESTYVGHASCGVWMIEKDVALSLLGY